jgi:heterotetrameric sarcosine oxidase gamma subunit
VVEALRSPFVGHTAGAFPNAAGQLGLTLSASLLPGTALVSTWISGIGELAAALQSAWGTVPAHTGQTANTAQGLVIRTGPEEFMVVPSDGAPVAQALRAIVIGSIGSVTDLSHARCRIHIEGAQSQATLNKLFALDLRESAFPVGEVRLSGTHHVPSALHRVSAESFDMLVFSTYAYDQLSTVMDAALEFGVTVTVP